MAGNTDVTGHGTVRETTELSGRLFHCVDRSIPQDQFGFERDRRIGNAMHVPTGTKLIMRTG